MTLVSPDKKDFSVIFVNNTRNQKTFKITAKDMAVASDATLKIWTTTTDSYLQKSDTDAEQQNGSLVCNSSGLWDGNSNYTEYDTCKNTGTRNP